MIRVLIADDHPIIRRRLHQALEEACDIVVAGEASNKQEVLKEVAHNHYDVVLLDISMPGHGGMEILHQLHHDKPGLHVLILSNYSEEQYIRRALREGASGYLAKVRVSEELIPAIRQVACGKKYVPSALSESLASSTTPAESTPRR